MGWGTEGDVHALDVDLSLVPLDKYRNYIKDKVVFFNNQAPQRLSCGKIGSSDYAMRAFGDDRSGDAPGDDELVKINLIAFLKSTRISKPSWSWRASINRGGSR